MPPVNENDPYQSITARLTRRVLPVVGAASLMATGCAPFSQHDRSETAGTQPTAATIFKPGEVPTIPTVPTPTELKGDECDAHNPQLAPYAEPAAVITEIEAELLQLDPATATTGSYQRVLNQFSETYQMRFRMHTSETAAREIVNTGTVDPALTDPSYKIQPVKDLQLPGRKLQIAHFIEGIGSFSPQMAAALVRRGVYVDLVGSITKQPGKSGYDALGGFYDPNTKRLVISLGNDIDPNGAGDDTRNLTIHEYAHAIEDLLCDGKSEDKEFTKHNSRDYVGYQQESKVDPSLLAIGPQREYVEAYSAASKPEDTATTIAWTFGSRGLILPGDPDYDSPLQHKQMVLVNRLERSVPGTMQFLQARTAVLRTLPANELLKIAAKP